MSGVNDSADIGSDSTLLVTGGAGYLGSQLVRTLATRDQFSGWTIRILDNLERSSFASLGGLPPEGRYQFIEGDVLDPSAVRRALEGVDAVIHLAALAKTPFSFDHPTWTRHVNQWGTSRIVEEALEVGVGRFVLASSASVYGPGEGFNEGAECQPVGPYSESKLEAERIVREGHKRGLDATVLRFGTLYGDAPAVRFDAVPNSLAYQAAVGRSVTIHGTGEQKRPVVHVDDAVEVVLHALVRWNGFEGTTVNAASQNISILEVGEILKEIRPFVRVRHTAQDVMSRFSLTVDGSRLEAAGWTPRYTLEDGLQEILGRYGRFEPLRSDSQDLSEISLA